MATQEDNDASNDPVSPRPFWSGVVTFGLVNLPVSLFSAYRGKPYSLKMVDQDGTLLKRRFFCEADGKALSADDIVRGYPLDDGTFIALEDAEIEAVEPKKSQEIELQRFVAVDELDPVYLSHAYFMVPDKRTTKAYRLLAQSMEQERRAGIATFVMRGREHLVAIIAENGILRAEVLRFSDEVRTPEQIGLPEKKSTNKQAVKAMAKAMTGLKTAGFKPAQLADDYHKQLKKLVQQKIKKHQDVVKAPEVDEADEEAREDNVIDLMQVLKARLQGKSEPAAAARNASSKRSHKSKPDLEELSKTDLLEEARKHDIAGRSKMNRTQLIRALGKAGN
ncbi:MAG TPA: Ku protein [Dongiaceae bacterium]|nr:Ku protein [Dongiaceae bacterium]